MTRLAAVMVLVGVTCLAAGPAQTTRFRSGADAVRVDVQVKRGNKPVAGLTADDFELRDSKVVQQVEAVAIEDVPVSLLLALDTSGSVKGVLLQQLKAAARAAVGALLEDDQAGLLTFSQRIGRPAALTHDRAAIRRAIDLMDAEGATALRDAIFTATALREAAPGRVILLVFTDGLDTISWLDPASVLDAALRSDMVVYAVSSMRRRQTQERARFEAEPDLFPGPFLEELAERTGGELLHITQGAQLAPAFAGIVSDFKSRYLLTYSPRNVPAGGWHQIEVKLKRGAGTVTARRGYYR